jgi:MFS family permease
MNRFRFSLSAMLLVIACFAVTCASLRFASGLLASIAFTSAVAALLFAVLGAVFRGGPERAFWIGFAVFGGGYLVFAFAPWFHGDTSPQAPMLLTSRLLALVHPPLQHPESPASGMSRGTNPSLAQSTWRQVYPAGPMLVPAWEHFAQVGHSLLTLLAALVGGAIARWLHWSNPAASPPTRLPHPSVKAEA